MHVNIFDIAGDEEADALWVGEMSAVPTEGQTLWLTAGNLRGPWHVKRNQDVHWVFYPNGVVYVELYVCRQFGGMLDEEVT